MSNRLLYEKLDMERTDDYGVSWEEVEEKRIEVRDLREHMEALEDMYNGNLDGMYGPEVYLPMMEIARWLRRIVGDLESELRRMEDNYNRHAYDSAFDEMMEVW